MIEALRSMLASTAGTLVLGLLALAAVVQAQCGKSLLDVDFNRYTGKETKYTFDAAKVDWGSGLYYGEGFERALIRDGELVVLHPKGRIGSGEGGTQLDVRLNEPGLTSATLRYRFKFQANYYFASGGKLPGMCDEGCPSGCVIVKPTDGWSSRLMFRKNGALVSYMYWPDMRDPLSGVPVLNDGKKHCGVDWPYTNSSLGLDPPGTKYYAEREAWQNLTLYVKLNTLGKADGVQKVWIGQTLVLDKSDIEYRMVNGHEISKFTFRNFHGGSTPDFEPDHDQYSWFDDFKMNQGLCEPDQTPIPPPPPSPPPPPPSPSPEAPFYYINPPPPPAPPPPTDSGLTATINPVRTFPAGFCTAIAISNAASTACTRWELTLEPDASYFQMGKFKFYNMKATSLNVGGFSTFENLENQQAVPRQGALTTRMPGMCLYWAHPPVALPVQEITRLLSMSLRCLT